MGVSLNPNTFTKGGLLNDIDVEVIEAIYTTDPPEGYPAHDRVFACLTLKGLDHGEEADQYWSAGKLADFTPTEDGLDLKLEGSRTNLNDNSNWSIFLSNLVNCGYPPTRLDEASAANKSMTALKGLQIHVVRVPAPERIGLDKTEKPGGRKDTILVPNNILKLPWEAKGKRATATGKKAATQPGPVAIPAAGAPSPTPASDDTSAEALQIAMDKLSNGAGPLPIAQLKTEALRRHMKSPVAARNAIVTLIGDKEWLASQGFTVTGEQVSIG